MARRRNFARRGKRRRTFWTAMGQMGGGAAPEGQGVNTANNVSRDLLLCTILSDQDQTATLVRIVGSVYVGLQASPAVVMPIYWGIYTAQSGGGGSIRLEADTQADISEETWLHWRVSHQFALDQTLNRTDELVDIKVMRKLEQGVEIRWNGICPGQTWHSCVNLRLLLMAT